MCFLYQVMASSLKNLFQLALCLTLPSEEQCFTCLLILNRNINTDIMKETGLARTFFWQGWKVVFSIACNAKNGKLMNNNRSIGNFELKSEKVWFIKLFITIIISISIIIITFSVSHCYCYCFCYFYFILL